MKILTATAATQGARTDDFDWAVEGELVWIGPICDRDLREPDDGGCGCGRAFSGLNSHRATTTARVSSLELTRDDVLTAYAGYLEAAGYGRVPAAEITPAVHEMIAMCAGWRTGTVIERRFNVIGPRSVSRSDGTP